jgi:hypothetical protein
MYDEPTEQVSADAPYRLTITAYSSPAQLTPAAVGGRLRYFDIPREISEHRYS